MRQIDCHSGRNACLLFVPSCFAMLICHVLSCYVLQVRLSLLGKMPDDKTKATLVKLHGSLNGKVMTGKHGVMNKKTFLNVKEKSQACYDGL
jgi:hypothetical protein